MSNPLEIKWPQDQFGNLTALRREGLRAVERMYGNQEKLDVLMRTLRTLAVHAQSRFDRQKAARDAIYAPTEPAVEQPAGEPVKTDE